MVETSAKQADDAKKTVGVVDDHDWKTLRGVLEDRRTDRVERRRRPATRNRRSTTIDPAQGGWHAEAPGNGSAQKYCAMSPPGDSALRRCAESPTGDSA